MTLRKLEICCGDIDSVEAAVAGGCDRIELCAALEAGGLTPSIGLIRKAVSLAGNARLHVLIRPREGDFVYTPHEVDTMVDDIRKAIGAGAHGVVIGALLENGDIDVATCRRLVEAASGVSVTFHRAFDLCRDPRKALEQIIELGCDRILTSGCAPTALQGTAMLYRLNRQAAGRIIILAGSGVSPDNAAEILDSAGVNELHGSARSCVASRMTFRNAAVSMGAPGSDEYSRMITDRLKVQQLANIIHSHQPHNPK